MSNISDLRETVDLLNHEVARLHARLQIIEALISDGIKEIGDDPKELDTPRTPIGFRPAKRRK